MVRENLTLGRLLVACGLLLGALGCDQFDDPVRPLSHTAPAPSARLTKESPLSQASREIAFDLAVTERRLSRELPWERSLEDQPCPDDDIRQSGRSPRLHLLVRDSRAVKRQLLPLAVTRSVAPDELDRVRQRFVQPSDALAARVYRQLRSLDDAKAAKRELDALAARPFAAAAHVVNYTQPRLTRKRGARRRHWVPGVLDTVLVVYDLGDRRALCQTRVTIRNDVTDAPIRIRLRSDTRERLKRSLAQDWQSRATEALSGITSVLELPVSTFPSPAAG